MVRRKIWQGLIAVLVLASVVSAQTGKTQPTDNTISTFSAIVPNSERSVALRFSEPTSLTDVERIVYGYGLSLQELNFEIENPYGETIYGGYDVDHNLTLDTALADFKQKHENFFNEAIESLATDIKHEKNKIVALGLRKLRNQFLKLLEEFNKDGLKLSSITVAENPSLSLMTNDSRFEKIEILYTKAKNDASTDNSLQTQAVAGYSWQPYRGSSKVNKSITFQVFYFRDVSEFGSNSTYEHETQVYNTNFANYANYYSTNLPSGYKDTQLLDSIDNFTIGTAYGSQLKKETQYYTSMALTGQSAATATVRIKGQKGYRSPSWCYSLWCVNASATTPSLFTFTAPINNQINW
jgi:hypothetical protein